VSNDIYINDFLRDRLDDSAAFDGKELTLLVISQYEEAVDTRSWATATALGKILKELAARFRDDPAYLNLVEP
jgi:hypothetical protein